MRLSLLFFDFIDEVIAEFMFWKLLRTLEILLEAFDPYVARTPNMEIMYMLAVSRTLIIVRERIRARALT